MWIDLAVQPFVKRQYSHCKDRNRVFPWSSTQNLYQKMCFPTMSMSLMQLLPFVSCDQKILLRNYIRFPLPKAVVHKRWGAEEWLWGHEQQPRDFAASIKFLELRISTLCYISKTKTRTDLCEVHIISIIIPIWCLLYSFDRPDCRIEFCEERVNPRGLRVPSFAGRVREPVLVCVRGGRGLNLLRGAGPTEGGINGQSYPGPVRPVQWKNARSFYL